MASHNELGKRGEDIAKNFFVSRGFWIRDSNWHSHHLEIDFVAENDEMIVIVEVKTRTGNIFGEPEDFISDAKMQRILKAANNYIILNNIEKNAQIDVVSIVFLADGTYRLTHFPDAITPKWYYKL
ncbi:MAG: YraN family protein [Paludibacter sp.]|nr:YraN family protein [Paludibacter sp.]